MNNNSTDVKDAILALLEKNRKEYLSGEHIGKILKISRSAVWKHVNALRNSGYKILSGQNKGYRLVDQTTQYNKYEIEKEMQNFGEIIFLEQTESTNVYAKQIASLGCAEGTIVIALSQTNGKGRLGRTWEASKGKGIWMSVVLRPDLPVRDIRLITLVCACAVTETLKDAGYEAGIKWPNDILINHKKVCGILTEMSCEDTRINYVIIGIGLNVFHTLKEFSTDIKDSATSLRLESDGDINMSCITARIINGIYKYYQILLAGDNEKIIRHWKNNAVMIGEKIFTTVNGKKEVVRALDIDPDGALVVQKEDGTVEKIISGEILI